MDPEARFDLSESFLIWWADEAAAAASKRDQGRAVEAAGLPG
jgi:hypothetical protein